MQKKKRTDRFIWLDIMITLIALEVMADFYYGARAVVLALVCVTVSLVAEIISKRLMRRRFSPDDLTCVSDAMITALMMPAMIEYRIPGMACLFAVIAAKNIFGGRKNMIFSPAAAAYVFILVSWKTELLSYPMPYDRVGIFEKAGELVNSASYEFNHTGTLGYTDFELMLGDFCGPAGAACLLLLIVSAVVLFLRRDISRGAFAGSVIGMAFLAYFCPVGSDRLDSLKYMFATNMTLFASIYIISDRRIAPGKDYFAFFYGLFVSMASYVVTITTGTENVIVIMSLLFTPLSLALRNLENRIDAQKLLEAQPGSQTGSRDEDTTNTDNGKIAGNGETDIADGVDFPENAGDKENAENGENEENTDTAEITDGVTDSGEETVTEGDVSDEQAG